MRARLLTPLLLVAVLAAGCGDDEEQPQALPSVAATSSAPSPTAAPVPPEAQAETPQGAAAFARFWFDTLNAAAATGETDDLRALAHPDCQACANFAESIDSLYTDGGGIRGGVFTVVAAESPGDDDAASAVVTVVYDVTTTQQLAKDGTVARELAGRTFINGQMTLLRSEGRWVLRELVTV